MNLFTTYTSAYFNVYSLDSAYALVCGCSDHDPTVTRAPLLDSFMACACQLTNFNMLHSNNTLNLIIHPIEVSKRSNYMPMCIRK